jgi:hypothetical protein
LACAVGASHDSARVAPELAPEVDGTVFARLDTFAARDVPS